jgi:hypothetical protein
MCLEAAWGRAWPRKAGVRSGHRASGAMLAKADGRYSFPLHRCAALASGFLRASSSPHFLPSPVYNVVGAVKGHSKFCEPEVESMAVWLPLPDRSSLDH